MGKKRTLFGILAALGMVVYANSLTGAYQYDDMHTIENNPYAHSLSFFVDFFIDGRTSSALPENSGYRPLSTLSYALCWAVADGKTWPFHVFKIFAHILAAWLVYLISIELLRKMSSQFPQSGSSQRLALAIGRGRSVELSPEMAVYLSVVAFLVHPGLSETVNYISATSTLQCALFYLAAFWFLLAAERGRVALNLALMAVCFFCSVLTKEEGATFPGAVILYALLFRDRSLPWRAWVKKTAPSFLVATAAFIGFVALYVGMKPDSGWESTGSASTYSYFITQVWAWVYYMAWIFRPWGYSIEHIWFGLNEHFYEPRVLAGIVINLAIFALVWLWIRRGMLLVAFGFIWFYLTILPASSFFPLTEPINEHRYYLSYAMLFPALGSIIAYGVTRLNFLSVEWNYLGVHKTKVIFDHRMKSWLLSGAFAALVLTLSVLTMVRNTVWRSEKAIWQDVVAKDDRNGRAHNNLGVCYLVEGALEEALKEFKRCSDTWDNYKYC